MKLLPNLLTSLRLVASPFLVWLIAAQRFREAVALVAFAAATDWFDGAAARRLGVSGHAGVILDPLADKTMLVTLFLALAYIRIEPLWLLALVIGRDLVIVVGALLVRIFRGVRKFKPSVLGKVSTFFQITYVLLALLHAAWPYEILSWLEITALVLTTIFTTLSGIGYVRLGIRMARRQVATAY